MILYGIALTQNQHLIGLRLPRPRRARRCRQHPLGRDTLPLALLRHAQEGGEEGRQRRQPPSSRAGVPLQGQRAVVAGEEVTLGKPSTFP